MGDDNRRDRTQSDPGRSHPDRNCTDRDDDSDVEGDGMDPVPPAVREQVAELSDAELRGLLQYVNEQLPAADDGGADERPNEIDGSNPDSSGSAESKTAESEAATGPEPQPERIDEQPDGVPSKATRVVKEINDNRYYYWQWRDGDSVKSKYDSPVDSG